jgi:F0F1-type ATP synthase delta subunit
MEEKIKRWYEGLKELAEEIENTQHEAEIKQKAKLKLFDLYDRCLLPIARITEVKYLIGAAKGGEDITIVELEGTKLTSAHIEAIQQTVEEVLKKKTETRFTIEPNGIYEPLKAKITLLIKP